MADLPDYLIEAIEEVIKANRKVELKDLPLASLRKALIDNGDPIDLSNLALDFVRISPRVYTANSGGMAAGTESGYITVIHGLGVTPTNVIGHLEDGTWSHQCSWRAANFDNDSVDIRFFNHGPAAATALLKFRLIY